MLNAFESTIEKTRKRIKFKKRHAWWDETVTKAYSLYNNKRIEFNMYKNKTKRNEKLFETIRKEKNRLYNIWKGTQEQNKKIIRNREFKKLNSTFCVDRIKGWKIFKRMFRVKTNTKLSAEQVKDEFKKHFTQRIVEVSSETNDHKRKVDEFIQNHRPLDQPETLIEYGQPKNIFKNLTNGKRAGFSGVTYEMFKYTHAFNKEFITSICKLFSVMITHGIIPYLFNISILVPLVKDSKKDLDDPNNLRPISI